MKTYFFMPSLQKISGGMTVIAQIASQLHSASWPVAFVSNGDFPKKLIHNADIPILQLSDVQLKSDDRWIVPEGWPGLITPALKARAKCVLYVQNWAFLHGLLPGGTSWRKLPVKMFAVSSPVSQFIKMTCGLNAPIIGPAIDGDIFHPGDIDAQVKERKVRIAWMPRKNRHLAVQIKNIFQALIGDEEKPEWIGIENMPPEAVAESMRAAHIFISTGFPEGFGLPPLEAMACGCLIAGFTGMGGWEYMRQGMSDGFRPALEIPERPWSANGFYAADGDVWGGALALKAAYEKCRMGQALPLLKAGLETASWYSQQRQKEQILSLWEDGAFWKF